MGSNILLAAGRRWSPNNATSAGDRTSGAIQSVRYLVKARAITVEEPGPGRGGKLHGSNRTDYGRINYSL